MLATASRITSAAATGAYTLVLRARSADGQTASDRVPLKIRARRAP